MGAGGMKKAYGKKIPGMGGTAGMSGGGSGRKAVGIKKGKRPPTVKPLPIKGKKRGR